MKKIKLLIAAAAVITITGWLVFFVYYINATKQIAQMKTQIEQLDSQIKSISSISKNIEQAVAEVDKVIVEFQKLKEILKQTQLKLEKIGSSN